MTEGIDPSEGSGLVDESLTGVDRGKVNLIECVQGGVRSTDGDRSFKFLLTNNWKGRN